MIQNLLRQLLAPAPEPLKDTDARLALAALLVRLARTDGLYAVEEVERIDRVLMQRFQLDAFGAAALRAEAEALEAEAPDTVRFTRALKAATSPEERSDLMQALWSVALADGSRDPDEDRLLRMVASLFGLSDVENALARQKAEKQS
ncbi:TerB family tellurite resistance protein [Xinfangfangia sp. D13-10-4-6]|uniref:tellurite resistance TerB family protein n=1 Tax=Pseudogemmobacter hezensis TaxID=2737662 RepID=UPI001551FA4F|nr:TerB family tellurite resistance protein [Pseudogemmobacter hezensis]NPD16215.1 TerB family tellurite resistance protein [Pseudogemmobacter hezensis]